MEILQIGNHILNNCGDIYKDYLRSWNRIHDHQKTWDRFKTHFRQAYNGLEDTNALNIGGLGFGAANVTLTLTLKYNSLIHSSNCPLPLPKSSYDITCLIPTSPLSFIQLPVVQLKQHLLQPSRMEISQRGPALLLPRLQNIFYRQLQQARDI